jgi:hypothetical protein
MFMSIASTTAAMTVIASPSIASTIPLLAQHTADAEIIRLGTEFEALWSIEREAWERVRIIDGPHVRAPLRATLAYDPDSAIDRHIASRLKREEDCWDEKSSFCWVPIERLRNVESADDQEIDRRIQELIVAREQWKALSDRPEVTVLDSQADAAASRTSEIVGRIENIPALTIEGLKVKARALRWCYNDEGEEIADFPEGYTTDARLARSIFNDLFAMNQAHAEFSPIGEKSQAAAASLPELDPVFAAIEAQRCADRELGAHLSLDEDLHDDDVIDDLSEKEIAATDELFRTAPRTPAGREALIRRAIQVIDARCVGDRNENVPSVTCGQLVALLRNLSNQAKVSAI